MTATILHNQSLRDFSIQHTGTSENDFLIALANGLSVTDDLVPGQNLVIPESVKVDKEVLNYYNAKGIKPATALGSADMLQVQQRGIGWMRIGSSFKVS